ncbi:hypothetical protein [Helicobacter sp. 23-1046]
MQKLAKFVKFIALGASVVFMFSACENKKELFERCYYDEIHSDDNRATKKRYEDDTKCLELAQLEEKSGNLDRALEHYIRACVKVNSLMPNACAKIVEFAQKDTDFNLKGSLEEECRYYDNKAVCFELKKIELSELKEPSPSDLWDFMDDFWFMCNRFSYIVPQSCDERDKTAQQYIRAVLALPKEEKSSYYVEKLDLLSYQTGSLSPKILQMASSARDEIIGEYENDCQINDAKSCAMLTSFYYGLLVSWSNDYIEDVRKYDREVDKIYAPKFQALAQKSCDLGNAQSCMQGAAFYYFYKPMQDYAVARQFGKMLHLVLKNAKIQGKLNIKDAEYLATLARIEAELDDRGDKAERKQYMLEYFKAGCDDLQSGVVCDKFAKAYDENYSMPEIVNQKQALHYYDKACALGVDCMRLAQMYLWGGYVGGKDVGRDLAKAKHYFTKDCENSCRYESGIDKCASVSCKIKKYSPKEFENLDESIFN